MSVLIDTSVWVDHFKKRNDILVDLLEKDLAQGHPMVLAELACGTPPAPRLRTLQSVGLLRSCHQASLPEVMDFIEREKLYGLGCGLIDIGLLASTLMTPNAQLWTLDKRLGAMAERFGIAFQASVH